MNVTHVGDRTIADTAAMAALTRRSPHSIRTLCHRQAAGYDVDTCTAQLEAQPAEPLLLTAAQAQHLLGVPAGTVRQWALRRRLVSHQRDERGSPLYDAARITELAGLLDQGNPVM